MDRQEISCDVLVIGGGTAGIFSAVTARKQGLDVVVADKAGAGYAGASIMASGFWAVFNEDWGMDHDSTLAWINKNSSYLNDRRWTEAFLSDSWGTYRDLVDWGVKFPVPEEETAGYFKTTIVGNNEGGHFTDDPHTHYGIVPLTHRAVTPQIRKYAQSVGVRFYDRVMITDLICDGTRVYGAVGFSLEEECAMVFKAKATVMSAGRNYFKPAGMNVSGQTGDADAIAYRAGAVISGKEFPDMHMNISKDPMWKGNGEVYPAYFHFDDNLCRTLPNRGFDLSLASTIHAGYGPIVWDFGKATQNDLRAIREYIKKRGNPKEIERVGLDPFSGGKYNMIGGAAAGGCQEQTAGMKPFDEYCASNLEGLYSAGDSCCTWMWGAIVQGPPPGLSPAGVTGKRAALGAGRYIKDCAAMEASAGLVDEALNKAFLFRERKSGFDPRWVIQLLQNYMMPYYILHIKEQKRLENTLGLVRYLREDMIPKMFASDSHTLRLAHEAQNMAENAEMILCSSMFRKESRGWHFREDFPQENDSEWLAWVMMKRGQNGMEVWKEALPEAWKPPVGEDYSSRWLAWEHPHEEVL